MAFTNTDKNLLIASMERFIQDGVETSGAVSLAALEAEIAGLRTAFGTSPASVTAAQINAAYDKLKNLRFPSLTTVSDVYSEAAAVV